MDNIGIEMAKKMICRKCNCEYTKLHKSYVCKKCKTVAICDNGKAISDEVEKELRSIGDYITGFDREHMHNIIQKYMNNEILSDEEINKKELLEKFKEYYNYFETIDVECTNWKDDYNQEFIYNLIQLGIDFNRLFNKECYILEI